MLGTVSTVSVVGSQAEVVNAYSNYCRTVLYRRNYPDSKVIFESGDTGGTQLLMYLDERGLGLEMLAPLFSTDVTDMDTLKNKMLSYYPQYKSTITEAFARYE